IRRFVNLNPSSLILHPRILNLESRILHLESDMMSAIRDSGIQDSGFWDEGSGICDSTRCGTLRLLGATLDALCSLRAGVAGLGSPPGEQALADWPVAGAARRPSSHTRD